jgi:CRISPR-associated protein Csb1
MDLSILAGAQALRATVELTPVDGSGGRIFPPTYPAEAGSREKAPRHVVEELPSGQRRVLVDSVASQANRQEGTLVAARSAGRIDFADVYVDLSSTEAGIDRLSATEMPHRLADAILRDSEIDGVPFAQSSLGRRLLATTLADLTPILETSPTSLLFGCWFSQHGQMRPLKIQRAATSDIWADDAVLGQAVGSRIDPLGIEEVQLYATADGAGGQGRPEERQAETLRQAPVRDQPRQHHAEHLPAGHHGREHQAALGDAVGGRAAAAVRRRRAECRRSGLCHGAGRAGAGARPPGRVLAALPLRSHQHGAHGDRHRRR